MNEGSTSFPQTGGAKQVLSTFNPSRYICMTLSSQAYFATSILEVNSGRVLSTYLLICINRYY